MWSSLLPRRARGRAIKENGYAEKYRASGKRITLLGLNFSSEKREIDGFLSEEAR